MATEPAAAGVTLKMALGDGEFSRMITLATLFPMVMFAGVLVTVRDSLKFAWPAAQGHASSSGTSSCNSFRMFPP